MTDENGEADIVFVIRDDTDDVDEPDEVLELGIDFEALVLAVPLFELSLVAVIVNDLGAENDKRGVAETLGDADAVFDAIIDLEFVVLAVDDLELRDE